MAYSKKLIHFATRANFDAQLAANNILGTSICFIKDAKQIWTHGLFYSCPFTEEEIEQLFVGSKIKLDGYIEMASPVNITETDTVNEAFGKIEDYLSDLVDLNAILVDTGDVATDPTINDYITPSELTNSLSDYATKSEIPTKVTELDNDANYATTDLIPTNVSQLTNDSDYITKTEVTDTYLIKGDYALKSDVEVEVEVEAPNGVYAITADGRLIDYNSADATALGVAFISDNQKVMIPKADATDGTNTTLYWGYNLNGQDVPNLENLFDTTEAMADFNGKANTAAIIAGYTALGVEMNSRDMCKVLETYNEGGYTDWYVPAAGQLYEFYTNRTAINEALAAISGTAFASDTYWSSSEESAGGAWVVFFNIDGVYNYSKNYNNFVRFVRDLNTTTTTTTTTIKKPLKERVSEIETKIDNKVGTNGTVTLIISLTQSEYDALVSAGSVVSTTLYIITN